MLNIAIGTRTHWNQVKHLYPNYKFYHESGAVPKNADRLLLITSSTCNIPKINCSEAFYIPEREYAREIPHAIKVDCSKPRLTRLEFHLADHCNLECDLCNHYCNLEKQPSFPDFDMVKKDLERIKELFWGIGQLSLVGGEPFLNKDLDKYCKMTREFFPDSDIVIFTNGVLLANPHMHNDLVRYFKAMEENDIRLVISKYEVTEKLIDKIKAVLNDLQVNVDVTCTPPITKFTRRLTLKPTNDKNKSYRFCHEKECHYLERGKIYGCTVFGRIKTLNKNYDTKFPDVGLDIYKYTTGWGLQDKLEHTYAYCTYCSREYENLPWSHGGEPKLENWIVTNPNKKRLLTYVYSVKEKWLKRLN